jgi:hypothetical protein
MKAPINSGAHSTNFDSFSLIFSVSSTAKIVYKVLNFKIRAPGLGTVMYKVMIAPIFLLNNLYLEKWSQDDCSSIQAIQSTSISK